MKNAMIFPGQGSQTVGMGKELASNYPAALHVFQAVDDALGEKLSDLIWNGQIEDLTLTENAQPALMANSMALLAVLETEGLDIQIFDFMAGLKRIIGKFVSFKYSVLKLSFICRNIVFEAFVEINCEITIPTRLSN